jgi:hypothetical protein
MRRLALCAWLFAVFLLPFSLADDPCVSGLQAGQRPGPYSALIATGPYRGQSFCFICDTGDRPAVIVFARSMNEPLGKLLVQLDQILIQKKGSDLRGWVTFLAADQPGLDPKLVDWSRKLGLKNLSLGVFEDEKGPPTYRLNKEADVTVLLSAKQKVVTNFAFRAGELNGGKAKELLGRISQFATQGEK